MSAERGLSDGLWDSLFGFGDPIGVLWDSVMEAEGRDAGTFYADLDWLGREGLLV